MKLILATNQTDTFKNYYRRLRSTSGDAFDYSGYRGLLFHFDTARDQSVTFLDTASNKYATEYDGIYINGYHHDYELAVAAAICAGYSHIPIVNSGMNGAPSMSKISEYARLASAGVPIPPTFAGAKSALLAGQSYIPDDLFPAVLKRADADRGIDNFKVRDFAQVIELLTTHEDKSMWILQSYIPNDGFYRVNFFGQQPQFSIFRSLEVRPDGNELKAHMYKPRGGSNARLVPLTKVPEAVLSAGLAGMRAMRREIGGVDALYDQSTGKAYILEVNYNPQVVTAGSFTEIREDTYIENLKSKW